MNQSARGVLHRPRRLGLASSTFHIALVLLTGRAFFCHAAEPFTAEDVTYFTQKIQPLLEQRCYECHSSSAKKLKGGLLLDSRAAVLKGGDTRPAVVPGQPDKSLLIEAVRYGNQDLQMPPAGKLKQPDIDALIEWVKMGAPWPNADAPLKRPKPPPRRGRSRRFSAHFGRCNLLKK